MRVVGGDWEPFVETTNGTWTNVIENWGIAGVSGISNERFDEIVACYGTYGSVEDCAAAPPATNVLTHASSGSTFGFWPGEFVVLPLTLADAEEEIEYVGAQLVAVNNPVPYTWSVLSGALPAGLTLNPNGSITGTPDNGTDGVYNFVAVATDSGGGKARSATLSLTVQSPAGPAPPKPWERSFTPLRTHYVTASGGCTSGGTCGEIGNPETFAHARGHAIAGDLHILRGGTYAGNFETASAGTSVNPIVWKGFIDANGDPENAYIDGGWRLDDAWNWVWALRFGDANSSQNEDYAIELFAPGTAVINSVVYDHCDLSAIAAWNVGSGQVVYGTIIKNSQRCDSTLRPHNIYTQNIFKQNGWKYFVQIISLDVFNIPTANLSNNLFNNGYANGTGARATGIHLQDSVLNQGRMYSGQHTNFTTGDAPVRYWKFHNNWYDTSRFDMYWRIGENVPAQMQITDSLFRNTQIVFNKMGMWGAGDGCWTYDGEISRFTGNEIYDPLDSTDYVKLVVSTLNGSCNRNAFGAAKIRDVDQWTNNTYGRSSGTGTFSLHANGSGPTAHNLAAWRTATDAARETAGGTAFDVDSIEVTTPTTDRVECFDNFYQAGWGYCRAINFDGNGSITLPGAEVDKIIGNGKTYKVRNARDFYGTPLESGTYTAGSGITVSPLPGDMVNGVLVVKITSQP